MLLVMYDKVEMVETTTTCWKNFMRSGIINSRVVQNIPRNCYVSLSSCVTHQLLRTENFWNISRYLRWTSFQNLIDVYGFDPKIHGVNFPSNFATITYLFFDTVLNYKQFIFPKFEFQGFYVLITVPAGEISWKLRHNYS